MTPFDESFQEDMADSIIDEYAINDIGPAIDHEIALIKDRIGLFESKEDKERRENLGVNFDNAAAEDDVEAMMNDDFMIDSILDEI